MVRSIDGGYKMYKKSSLNIYTSGGEKFGLVIGVLIFLLATGGSVYGNGTENDFFQHGLEARDRGGLDEACDLFTGFTANSPQAATDKHTESQERVRSFSATDHAGVLVCGDGVVLGVYREPRPAPREQLFRVEVLALPQRASRGAYPYGNGYVLLDHTRLSLYDSELTLVGELETGRIGAIAVSYPYIYLAAGGGFAVYDQSLEELSRVRFTFPDYYGSQKNVHHVILHEKIAYLLDNVIEPIFVFQVEVENPLAIQTVFEYEFFGLNEKLHSQWIDLEANAWAILHSNVYMGGSGFIEQQGIHLIALEDGAHSIVTVYLKDNPGNSDRVEEMLERLIIADAALSPNWFVTVDQQRQCHLAATTWREDQLVFNNLASLDFIDPDSPVRITADEDHLYLTNRGHLYILEVAKHFELVFQVSLAQYGLNRIVTLEPF